MVAISAMESILSDAYYNLKNPTAFSGEENVYRAVKKKLPNLKRKDVRNWFENQLTHTLHKPIRYNFKRFRTIVKGIDEQWQADLCDMTSLASDNSGKKFLLTCIDCFSKFAWVQTLSNKTSSEIVKALKQIMSERKPKRLQTDKGTEFLNKDVQNFLKNNDVNFFTTNTEMKASIVERFNRTLKSRMYKYFTAENSRRYVDVLQDLVRGYNNSKHRSIGMKPIDVRKRHEHVLRMKLYPKKKVQKNYKYNVGDLVRVSKTRRTFRKGYLPSWTEEIFRIYDRKIRTQPAYYLQDYNKELIKGLFYEKELQRVHEQDEYRVEKVLKKKRVNGKNLYFVKWKGWSNDFNSWVEHIHRI